MSTSAIAEAWMKAWIHMDFGYCTPALVNAPIILRVSIDQIYHNIYWLVATYRRRFVRYHEPEDAAYAGVGHGERYKF